MSEWRLTGFGTAEQLMGWAGWEGRFYSHNDDLQGARDVTAAAVDFIERTVEDEVVKKISLKLLEQEGPETDLYMRQSRTRWLVDTNDIVQRATAIKNVL